MVTYWNHPTHIRSLWSNLRHTHLSIFLNDKFMANNVLEMVIPADEQEEIKEFVATLLLIPKEDGAVLLSNANAFKVRADIKKAREV